MSQVCASSLFLEDSFLYLNLSQMSQVYASSLFLEDSFNISLPARIN
jgi:hypothetical protein